MSGLWGGGWGAPPRGAYLAHGLKQLIPHRSVSDRTPAAKLRHEILSLLSKCLILAGAASFRWDTGVVLIS